MILDEKLRWFGFWLLDALKGKKVRTYYDQIRRAWKEGTSIAETEERIRALIAMRWRQPNSIRTIRQTAR